MNDCIFRIRVYASRKGDTLSLNPTYIGHQLNRTPMKTIDYTHPVEKMKEFLNKFDSYGSGNTEYNRSNYQN